MTVGGMDYSKYAEIANSTKTVNINGEKVQLRGSTSHTSQWSTVSSMHSMVNNGDAYFCTDGVDDGEISGKEKAGIFVDGMGDSVKEKLPALAIAGGTWAIGSVAAPAIGTALAGTAIGAACAAAAPVIAIVGGAALVVTGIITIGKGISQFIKGAKQAENATTDMEAKQAWHSMGDATVDTAYGVGEAYIGGKIFKAGVAQAKETGQLDEWKGKADQAKDKAKSYGEKIKNKFKKGGKTDGTTGDTGGTTGQTGNTTGQTGNTTGQTGSTTGQTGNTGNTETTGQTANTTNAEPLRLEEAAGTIRKDGVCFRDAQKEANALIEQLKNNPSDKSVYRKISKLTHPDAWPDATVEELKVLEDLFKQAGSIKK